MNRNDFINTLFDNGRGLTLDQIATIEKMIPDIVMIDEVIDDFMNANGYTRDDAIKHLRPDARFIFMDQLVGCDDMLDMRDYLQDFGIEPTDLQIYALFHMKRG